MSYDNRKKDFTREKIDIVELELDFCANTFGVFPCTASGSGDAKCVNTFNNCQDKPNYVKTTKIYKFCTQRSPQPIGLDAIPSLVSVSMAPAVIDIKGGLGIRSSISLKFKDHPSSDIGIDPYVSERTSDAFNRGLYWTKMRARNPNYQYRPVRHLSGYLVDGVYDVANFQTRHYVIDRFTASGGSSSVVGKDPLKLAAQKKAQVPAVNTGQLLSALSAGVTTATLTPTGVGNLEYASSGTLVIKNEVMTFTRSGDVLTLVRGQRNTADTDHSANDTVQQCYVKNDQVHIIVKDLLTNFCSINPTFINDAGWQAEVDTYLSGLLDGIIVKPMDVAKVLVELSEAMPHYLFWDERTAKIELAALKPPPVSANTLNMDEHLIGDTVNVNDMVEERVSTVFVNFGQFDPTKKIDEFTNYQQTHIRIDTDSIVNYGSSEVKTIYSRWISNTNKAAALQLAALVGRRFANIPRSIDFDMDDKDSDVWIGQSRAINHRDILDDNGFPSDTVFQITSVSESDTFKYSGIEYTYGEALPEDEGGGDPGVDLVIIGTSLQNITLRTIYDGLFPAPDASTVAKFVVENGVTIGSATLGVDSLDTGVWPAGASVTLQTNSGSYIVGRGGNGEDGDGSPAAQNGSDAINLSYDLTIINNGIIGGGGAGGGSSADADAKVGGGGGAGNNVGQGGGTTYTGDELTTLRSADNGTVEEGGLGGRIQHTFGEPVIVSGEAGGDLGQSTSAATGGKAIDKNGFILTETVTGDIRGVVS